MLVALALTAALFVPAPALRAAEDTTVVVRADIAIRVATLEGDVDSDNYTDKPLCSGVVVQSRGTRMVVATARHCASAQTEGNVWTSPTPTRVGFFDGDVGIVKGVRTAPSDDVALLDVQSMRAHPAARQVNRVQRGQALFVLGMPKGWCWGLSTAVAMQGAIPNGADAPFERAFMIESASATGGDSGAALWDYAGNAVGILVASDSSGHLLVEPIALLATIR
jgi:hypothetical protein